MSNQYLDLFRQRVSGSVGDAYADSTKQFIEQSFADSPNYRVVTIDGVDVGVRVLDEKLNGSISANKTLLFRPNTTVDVGAYVTMNGDWLIVDFLTSVMPKASVKQCNNELTIQTGVNQVITGYDSLGRPITYDEPILASWKCVVESRLASAEDMNAAINFADNRIVLTLPYDSNIKEDAEFTMWGDGYKIVNVDKTKVINGKGIVLATAQRL